MGESSTTAFEGKRAAIERVDEMNCQVSGSCCVAGECEVCCTTGNEGENVQMLSILCLGVGIEMLRIACNRCV